ncbi:MAG: GNAT family N-acetyltransferase [Candidatus Omnitrophica bacterium]|nr:GNAT family N-acetyltransferase [Candidatus Omnitrophota bacterium]MBU1997358.1 GNAT family N-acetyltransferase [Candidatus Omnitrophota bacterium]MBU4333108.1 GNAT family N-acetyltransferase [Candidatus Omnitrophota bacterium]
MFRIRRILEASTRENQAAITQVQALMREQFGAVKEKEVMALNEKLNDPLKYCFQTRLFIAEKGNGPILGFALLLYVPDIEFCYLDFMATGWSQMGRGLGSALYERVREEAFNLKSKALLFECLPDDPTLSPDDKIRKQNIKRLAFYEKYGAYPIEGSFYETPLSSEDTDPPYLVADLLGNEFPDIGFLKKAIRAILERKYSELCPKEYIERVVRSFDDPGIKLRVPRYQKHKLDEVVNSKYKDIIIYVANEAHNIHHVKERGYVESPVRLKVILGELEKLSFMKKVDSISYPDRFLLSVHDPDYVSYIKKACFSVPDKKSVYPYVFPIRNESRKPKEMAIRAGYYCIDTFTPLNANAYKAARSAVDCVLTATDVLLSGKKVAYALVRPPGHHAERRSFGGFCYFANTAIAAQYLSQYGKVAILDIDYHHGNGQQDIFYDRSDVLTISLHGNPKFAYPYFTGFEDEVGEGNGYGYNINVPLSENISVEDYLHHVSRALKRIKDFAPVYFIVAFGLDTAKADPTGTWSLKAENFKSLGEMIGDIDLPTLIVQEGGYRTQTLGINARKFFSGLQSTAFSNKYLKKTRTKNNLVTLKSEQVIRRNVKLGDIENIRELVKSVGNFSEEEVVVAGELVAESVSKGRESSGYYVSIMEDNGELLGYVCYGPVPFTESVYNLYWIVVSPKYQRQNIAGRLLADAEEIVKKKGGDTIYIDTSSEPGYLQARTFYLKKGFVQCSEYTDFYKKGDSKLVFKKIINC